MDRNDTDSWCAPEGETAMTKPHYDYHEAAERTKFDQDLKALQAVADAWYQVAICDDADIANSGPGTVYTAMRDAWDMLVAAIFPDEVRTQPNLSKLIHDHIIESDLSVTEAIALVFAPPAWFKRLPKTRFHS